MLKINQSTNPLAPARIITTSELAALRLIPQVRAAFSQKFDGNKTTGLPTKRKAWDTEGDK